MLPLSNLISYTLVDSNDTLYAQDEKFLKEIQVYSDIIFQELLENFKRNQSDVSASSILCPGTTNLILIFPPSCRT